MPLWLVGEEGMLLYTSNEQDGGLWCGGFLGVVLCTLAALNAISLMCSSLLMQAMHASRCTCLQMLGFILVQVCTHDTACNHIKCIADCMCTDTCFTSLSSDVQVGTEMHLRTKLSLDVAFSAWPMQSCFLKSSVTLLYCIARKADMPTCPHLNIPGGMCHPSPHLVWMRLSAVQSCLTGLQWYVFLCPLLLLKSSNGLI